VMRNGNGGVRHRRGPPARQPAILSPPAAPQQRPDPGQYDFLVGTVIDAGTLARAAGEAARCGVATHEALIAMGLPAAAYAAALAHDLGVPLANWDAEIDLGPAVHSSGVETVGPSATVTGRRCRVLCAESRPPEA